MEKTHYKKLQNLDYIGAYSLEPGKDLILTINKVTKEIVTGPNGKKEECMIMTFKEKSKPMIVNRTNAKTITKLFESPYIEDWSGRTIQIYATDVKFGADTVEALRIRPFIPKTEKISTICSDCSNQIQPVGKHTAEQIAALTYQKYSKPLCSECASKLKDAGKVDDPL